MKRTTTERINGFFREKFAYFLAVFPVLFLYLFMLVVDRVFPFGDYTVASYDLSSQICPYIEHLFDVIEGKSTLFYSYSIAGGADVFGGLAYFIVSPFSFLFLLFGDGRVAEAVVLVVPLKLICIALAGTWFSKKFFTIPDIVCALFGVLYAYCGYTFVANTYINWLDFLIYAPIAVAAFLHFVKTGKYLPFALVVALFVYTCFSIACFSMLTVYPVLIAYTFFCVEKGKRKRFIAYLSLAFLVGVLLALPILVPALLSYLRSFRSGNLFAELYYGFTGEGFDAGWFWERYSTSLDAKWTYILSDAAFVVLTVFYFIRKGLKSAFSRFFLVAGIYTMLPTIVDESMLLLNMGSYLSYALRFGFLNAIYFLGGACLAVDGLDLFADKPRREEGELLVGRGKNSIAVTYISISAILIVALAILFAFDLHKTMWDFLTDDKDFRDMFRAFASRFAHSIGGIATVALIFLVAAAVLGVGIALVKKGKVATRAVTWLMIALLSVQIVFFNEQLVAGNLSAQNITLAEYGQLTSVLQEEDDSYFRIRDYNDALTANAPFTGGGNSYTVFSSMVDEDNMVTATLFGFSTNGKNTFKGNGGSVFGESFLGYKYIFVTEKGKDSAELRTYWKKKVVESGGEFSQLAGETFSVYENEIVFPSGYLLDEGEFRFPKENTGENSLDNQRALYNFLSGKEVTGNLTGAKVRELSVALHAKSAKVEVGAGKITAQVTAEKEQYLFLNFVASKGYFVTVNGQRAELVDNDLKFLCVKVGAGENVVEFIYESPYPVYALTGGIVGVIGLFAVWFVTQKTKVFEKSEGVICVLGITLAAAVTAFFFLFPTGVWLVKLAASLFSL